MKKKRLQKVVRRNQKHRPTLSTIIYLFFILLLLLATLTVVQQSSELRQFAQTATPTPMLRCNVVCTYNSQCPTGLFCSSGLCRNPSCPAQDDCTCSITPTINPYAPTRAPYNPTNTPISVKHSPTPQPTVYVYPSPTEEVLLASPSPAFEITKEQPKNISLFEAVIQFIGTIFCKLFRSC
jgi:hypothetical protein